MTALAERMARHGFVDRPCPNVAAAAAHTVAIQAQDLGQARLGVRARAATVTEDDVTAALADRAVVRTWLMRNTIHLVAADDLRFLVREFGPLIRRRFARRWDELGLTPDLLTRAETAVPGMLAAGPLTRHEVADGLRSRGITVGGDQAPTHLMVHLATTGLTCHADGDRFALTDDWVPHAADGPRGDDARAELARRYFRAFSPATAADFTAWSGLPSGRAIGLIRDELVPVEVNGRRGFRLGAPDRGTGVRLLSGFDNLLIGYRDRTGLVPDERRGEVYVGGIIRPTIVRDGVVVGRWRLDRANGRVQLTHFAPPPPALRSAVADEVEDLARFVGRALSADT
ncbi:MAG TPA: winged helix DNA-binding domain-containing protein [Jatrophihabitans sp.]